MMNKCQKIISLLPFYISKDLSSSEMATVERHLEGCSKCTKELTTYREIQGTLASLKRETLNPEFWEAYSDQVMQKIKASKPAPVFMRTILAWARVAAVFLLGLSVGYTVIYLSRTEQSPVETPEAPLEDVVSPLTPIVANDLLGVKLQPVNRSLQTHYNLTPGQGVVVFDYLKGVPADKLDIKPHDIILEINGKPVNIDTLQQVLPEKDKLNAKIIRGGVILNIEMNIEIRINQQKPKPR